MTQLATEDRQDGGLASRLAEIRSGLHRQDDPGEGGVELGKIDGAPPDRRVVEISAPVVEPFQNHEMIEVPVDDAWHRQFVQRAGLLAEALGRQSVPACRLDHVARLGTVPRYAARDAQPLQGDPQPVMREDHREACGPAFDPFHLQDGRSSGYRSDPQTAQPDSDAPWQRATEAEDIALGHELASNAA